MCGYSKEDWTELARMSEVGLNNLVTVDSILGTWCEVMKTGRMVVCKQHILKKTCMEPMTF